MIYVFLITVHSYDSHIRIEPVRVACLGRRVGNELDQWVEHGNGLEAGRHTPQVSFTIICCLIYNIFKYKLKFI